MNKSALFSIYNVARTKVERGRVNRALGLLQRKDGGHSKFQQYHTTLAHCDCTDFAYKDRWCKHQLALALQKRAGEKWTTKL